MSHINLALQSIAAVTLHSVKAMTFLTPHCPTVICVRQTIIVSTEKSMCRVFFCHVTNQLQNVSNIWPSTNILLLKKEVCSSPIIYAADQMLM